MTGETPTNHQASGTSAASRQPPVWPVASRHADMDRQTLISCLCAPALTGRERLTDMIMTGGRELG